MSEAASLSETANNLCETSWNEVEMDIRAMYGVNSC